MHYKNRNDAAFASRSVLAFESTVGFELLGHLRSALLLAPCRINAVLPNGDDAIVQPLNSYSIQRE